MMTTSSKYHFKYSKGFSLLEVIIALGILASIMMVLTSSWKGNFRRVKKAKLQSQAVYLLQKKATELEILYKNKFDELPKDLQTGKFEGENFKKYSWQWKTQEFKMPDIARLFAKDEGLVDETTLKVLRKMRKFLEESIKEVKITLVYKDSPKSKPQTYSIATIFVDYEVALDLGINIPGAPGN